MSNSILRNKGHTQSQTNIYSRRSSQEHFRPQRYEQYGNVPQSTKNQSTQGRGLNDAISHQSYQNNGMSQLITNPQKGKQPLNLTKKMVRVLNGKIVPVDSNNLMDQNPNFRNNNQNGNYRAMSQSQLPNLSKSQANFCAKPCSNRCTPAANPEDLSGVLNNVESILSTGKKSNNQQCPAENDQNNNRHNQSQNEEEGRSCQFKSQMESEVDSYINMNDIYYKHLRGLCICYRCTCGKHKCAYAKNSHLKMPFNQTPAQSIYKINYVPKKGLKDIDFDYGMYENMKGNINTIDLKSVNHTDFTKPDNKYYSGNHDFKPNQKYDYKPLQCGRSHYKRDFLEWGCVPYQPIKGYSQRTTIDAMPFHGQTTYNKDYYKMNFPEPQKTLNNHTTTMVKSPIPFLGVTTSQEFFKPFKPGERAIRYKASDELITGAPAFKGQFESLSQKDFVNYQNICPVEIELSTKKEVNPVH